MDNSLIKSMPDITNNGKSQIEVPLEAVGMSEVETLFSYSEGVGSWTNIPAEASMYVNLIDPKAKGIHMSRLYRLVSKHLAAGPLSRTSVESLLLEMIESQDKKADWSEFKIEFKLPLERKALVSELKGLRHYKLYLLGSKKLGEPAKLKLGLEIYYSSTCPCSAALSRQLVQEHWKNEFKSKESVSVDEVFKWLGQESSIVATPHAQRSTAEVEVTLGDAQSLNFVDLINSTEACLGTPVQSAVKREDEQEFARLNASQLMFCEDAARKIHSLLAEKKLKKEIVSFKAKVSHIESLHPHNAVAFTKSS